MTTEDMRDYITETVRLLEGKYLNLLYVRARTLRDMSPGVDTQAPAADTRQRIAAMLERIASESSLNRIYRFVKYIYIYKTETTNNEN